MKVRYSMKSAFHSYSTFCFWLLFYVITITCDRFCVFVVFIYVAPADCVMSDELQLFCFIETTK